MDEFCAGALMATFFLNSQLSSWRLISFSLLFNFCANIPTAFPFSDTNNGYFVALKAEIHDIQPTNF